MVTRIKTVLITAFFLFPFYTTMASDKSLFAQGNASYRQGNFHRALEQYAKMSHVGPGVWFNRGSCFFELQEYHQALICWYKSQRRAPAALVDVIDKRIAKVRDTLHKPEDDFLFWRTIERWAHMIPVLFLQVIFLCCWYALGICLSTERRIRFQALLLAVGLLLMLLTGLLLLVHYSTHLSQRAIALKDTAMFIGPHEQFHEVGTIAALDTVRIKDGREGWYKVEANSITGWIEADAIEII